MRLTFFMSERREICLCKGEWRKCEYLDRCSMSVWVGCSSYAGYMLYMPGGTAVHQPECELSRELEELKKIRKNKKGEN